MAVLTKEKASQQQTEAPTQSKGKGLSEEVVWLAQATIETLTSADNECGPVWAQGL